MTATITQTRTLGAASGAVGAALYGLSAFTAGSPLKPDASAQKVVDHLTANREALLVGVLLNLVATGLLLCFLAYLASLVAEAEGDAVRCGS